MDLRDQGRGGRGVKGREERGGEGGKGRGGREGRGGGREEGGEGRGVEGRGLLMKIVNNCAQSVNSETNWHDVKPRHIQP